MYAASGSLDLLQLEAAARECYAEMLEAGYTAVGEFHYLHHQPNGHRYDDPVATSRAMLRAARQVGIRITLLHTVYTRGGLRDEPLSPRQARFGAASLEEVERNLDLLSADPLVDGAMGQLGLAIHSVRAVPPPWLGPLAELARSRGIVLHAHASEQTIEVDECRQVTGLSPIGLLHAEGVLSPATTLVHATHLDDADIATIASTGSGVCLCPTTEGDLGDGVPRTPELYRAGVRLSIGSDSHAVIDPFAELRSAEYQARAATGTRCVLLDEHGEVARVLTQQIGHANGYAALGLPLSGPTGGPTGVSNSDDAVMVDMDARALRTSLGSDEELMAAAVTAGHPGLVSRVRVGGEEVVVDGKHVERRRDVSRDVRRDVRRTHVNRETAALRQEPGDEQREVEARPLRTLGDPVLRAPCTPVPEELFGSDELTRLCDELIATMRAANGAGIAAPQIGESTRVFVVHGSGANPRYPYKPRIPLTVFVNPKVEVIPDGETLELIEGCLSVPGWRGQVSRHARVVVRARRPDGSRFEVHAAGHAAATLQHENDHINGVLFPDVARPGPFGPERLMSWAAFEAHYADRFVPYALELRDRYPEAYVVQDVE